MFKMMEQNPQFAMYANMQQSGMMPQLPRLPQYSMPSPRVPNAGGGGGGQQQPVPDQSGNPYAPRGDGGRGGS